MTEPAHSGTSLTPHGKAYNRYLTTLRADLEDSYWENNAQDEGLISSNLYFSLLQRVLDLNPSPSPITVLEIGTGPGRVLISLAQRCSSENVDLSRAHFIGLDNASPQIELAERYATPKMRNVGKVDWMLGDACAFASQLRNLTHDEQHGKEEEEEEEEEERKKKDKKVHFMPIFNFGSVFHLDKHDQVPRLFREVAETLEPETGVACISLMHSTIIRGGETTVPEGGESGGEEKSEKKGEEEEEEARKMHDDLDTARWESERFPGIVYDSVPLGQEVEEGGEALVGRIRIKILRKGGEDGTDEEVLEEYEESLRYTRWAEDEFVGSMREHGLVVTDTVEGVWETFYILKLEG